MATPNVNLLVNRNSDYSDNSGTQLLGSGFPRDIEKYGLYSEGNKAKVNWSEFKGPQKSLKDLDPINMNMIPVKSSSFKANKKNYQPKATGDYGNDKPSWLKIIFNLILKYEVSFL